MELNKLDTRILRELMKNSRQSYHSIAKKLKLSAATVMSHVKRLEDEKIIKEYTIKLDYDKMGWDLHAFIDLRISKGNLFMVEKKIATHPNVIAVYDKTGNFDATVVVRFKSRLGLDKFLKRIQAYNFVERTETKLILNVIKEENLRI